QLSTNPGRLLLASAGHEIVTAYNAFRREPKTLPGAGSHALRPPISTCELGETARNAVSTEYGAKMSSVSDYVRCEQCGFESAYYDFNCGSNEWDVSCGKCGYYSAAERHEDCDRKVTWTYPEEQGCGVLFYHCVNDLPYCHHPLHSKESVEDAEKWLREKLACGDVDASCS